MNSCYKQINHVFLMLMLTLLISGAPAFANSSDLSVDARQLVAKQRVGRSFINYTYTVTVSNSGAAKQNVVATVSSLSPNTVIVENTLVLGSLAAGATIQSTDTFTLRQNRRVLFNPDDLIYTFSYDLPSNTPPVADAGADQSLTIGSTAQLDGSASSDADGNPLTFLWSLMAVPNGSGAMLSDPLIINPTLFIDLPGDYIINLVVDDGSESSPADSLTISTENTPPVADAGADQSVFVGNTAILDGSGSSDIDGDALTFSWSLSDIPAGSSAAITDPTAIMPRFDVDTSGSYTAELVVNDMTIDSLPDTVTITTENSAPIAHAGPDQAPFVGETVTLNGSLSSDADGDNLTFSWSLTSIPPDSSTLLADSSTEAPSFLIDAPGQYVGQLIVNDGSVDSLPDTVTVTTENTQPTANAGLDQQVQVGSTVTLDGSLSNDADGDDISYAWSITTKPLSSLAEISDPAAANPNFIADLPGMYIVQLVINDGQVDSEPDTAVIDTENQAPTAVATASANTVPVNTPVQLNGSASSDPDGDAISYQWSLSRPVSSSASLSATTSANPSFTPDVPGVYVMTLIVNDQELSSAPATVSVTATNTNNPPDLIPVGNRTISADQTFDTHLFAVDPDANDTLTFSLTTAPTGMTMAPDSGALSWTPGAGNLGMHNIEAKVTDNGGLTDSEAFTVEVIQALPTPSQNNPPQLDPIADQTFTIGDMLSLTASASDSDTGDMLTFSLPLAPAGMTIAPLTGAISWTPDISQSGLHDFSVQVTDSAGAIAIQSAIITVNAVVNRAPVAVDDIYIADITRTLTVAASGVLKNDSDVDGSDLTVVLVTPPENGDLSLRPDGSFDFTPRRPIPLGGDLEFVTNANLSFLAMPTFAPDAARRGGTALERTADDDLTTSGLPTFGRYEQIFDAEDITVRRVEIFGDRELASEFKPITEGIVRLFDRSGVEVWNSGTLVFPLPNRDLVVSVNPPVSNVHRVQFEPTTFDASSSGASGFTVIGEFHVYGDGHVQQLPMQLEWAWNGEGRTFPGHENVHTVPLVADLNGDDAPEVIFTSATFSRGGRGGSILRIVDGRDGNDLLTVPVCVQDFTSMAVGDIDGDGRPEIIAGKASVNSTGTGCSIGPQHVIAIESDGTIAWESEELELVSGWGGITLADLDGDGSPEILIGRQAVSNTGKLLWTGEGRLLSDSTPEVADINLDGLPEIIIGSNVLNADGSLMWEASADLGRYSVVGNFDDDPQAEVFVVGANRHVLYEHDGSIKWIGQGGFGGGPPTVGDFDGDGEPEIGISGGSSYLVLETDGSVKWRRSITDSSSGRTGSSLFDFDGDGRMEVVQRDQEYFRIWDGATGNVRFRVATTSVTANEYPIVADVDGDGQAEVVVPSTAFGKLVPERPAGLYVFGGRDKNFVRARPIWNQHAYHVTNVNADGSIPADEPENWLLAEFNHSRVNDFLPSEKDRADQFTYRASDGSLSSDEAAVYIDIVKPNSGPEIVSSPDITGTPGFDYFYDVQAIDKDRDPLIYTFFTSPTGMTIDAATGLIRWAPTDSYIGDHSVILQVNDGRGLTAWQFFTLTVAPPVRVPDVLGQTELNAAATLSAQNLLLGKVRFANHPTVAINRVITQIPAAGSITEVSNKVGITLSLGPEPSDIDDDIDGFSEKEGDCDDADNTIFPGATDVPGDGVDQDCDGSDATVPPAEILVTPVDKTLLTGEVVSLTATGINSDGTSRNMTGLVNWSAGPDFSSATAGSFTVSASLAGVSGSASINVVSRVSGDAILPVVAITAPVSDATITEPVDVIGTATDANFLKYELGYAIAGNTNFTTITTGTSPVANGVLGQFDPTMLINDQYTIRLTVFDTGGNSLFTETTVQVGENLKVGNFTLSFTDLQVPMSGIPITVTRTYDSRDKQKGDFGVGWRLDVNSLRIRTNRTPGTGWEVVKSGLAFGLVPTDVHKVSLTLASGRVEEFDLVISPTVSPLVPFPPLANRASFQPRPGTLGTLTSLDNNNLSILAGQPGVVNLLDDLTNQVYNPQRFKYTAADGTEIVIHKRNGVESVRDPNGNTLTFNVNGIVHSGGKSVLFHRDAEGRITQLTDPNGNVQTYTYDANGDLTRHTDAGNKTTQYSYNGSHGLVRMDDPSGNQPIRNEYDSDGRLISSTDANGNRVQYVHNPGTRQSRIIDQLGGATVYEYDAKGNVLTQTNALGGVTTFSYDVNNNKVSETDPLGNSFTFTYDAQNNLLSQSDAMGNVARYTYNALGKRTSKMDLMGNVTLSTYSANGENLLSETDALGNVTRYSYDASGNLLTLTDAAGNITAYTYNGSGDRLTDMNALGEITTFGYDAIGNRTSEVITRTLTDGTTETLTTLFQYDQAGRQVATTDPNGDTIQVEYDFGGKKTAEVDKSGNRTTFVYDGAGNLLRTVLPGSELKHFNYDGNGNRITKIDEAGNITRYSYDALDRLVGTISSDGGTTVVAYDATGEITSNTDARGNQTWFSFDANGRRTLVTDALGQQTAYTYDANGNTLSVSDANGNTTAYAYDVLNRRVSTTFQDGTFITISYDQRGNKTAEIDQAGETTRYAYDALNRLVSVTDALGQVVSYAYDEVGNRITETDANGNITRREYDGAKNLSRVIHPLGTTESYTYDGEGNPTSHKDANGNTTLFSYDSSNRLVTTLFPDGSSEDYTYTATGQRASDTTASGTTTYSYDSKDRLNSVVNSDGSILSYTYDAMDNRTSVTAPSGVTRTTFDVLNRPLTVTDTVAGVTTYGYDPAGNRVAMKYPNGATTSYTYDTLDRLVSVANKRSDDSEISAYTYTLDPAGNRVRLTESGGRIVDYSYDALYRLKQETITDPTLGNSIINYTYDSHGNRLTKSDASGTRNYVYDANDRLLSDGITTYSYDANGNTLGKASGAGSVSYIYDFENQMVSIPSNGMVYTYDADGVRVESNINGTITRYVVDKNRQLTQVLEEQDSSGATLVSYTYGDDLVSQQRAGANRYYIYDGQMSTRLLMDGSEVVTDTYVYDAFGQLLGSSGGTENNFLYTGEQYDPNVGFYYLRSRYYNPELGRFTSKDDYPADRFDPGTLHRYAYVKNNPVNFIDPTGEFFTLTGIVVAISVDSSLGKAYGKMLGKVLLTSLRFSKCLLEPGAQLRDLGLELVTDPRMGHVGARMVVMGNEMIAEGFGKLRDSLNKIVEEFANSLLPKLEVTFNISVDVSNEVAKAYQGYQKYQEYMEKINKVTEGLVKVESFLRDLVDGKACDVLAFIDDKLNPDD